jgi:AcrR family transcriptional regulator
MPRGTRVVPGSDREEMRQHLLTVAMNCFERHGIDKTVMDDIAKAAGVSRPTVYHYIGDRSQVLLALVAQRGAVVIEKTRRVIARQASFDGKLVEGMLHAVKLSRNDPFLGLLVTPTSLEPANAREAAAELSVELNVELWMSVLEEGRASGSLRPELDLHYVCAWISQVEFILLRADSSPQATAEMRKAIRTFVLPALISDSKRANS